MACLNLVLNNGVVATFAVLRIVEHCGEDRKEKLEPVYRFPLGFFFPLQERGDGTRL